MTNKELTQAIEMNQAGIPWKYVANHFRVTELELRNKRKHYYETNKTKSSFTSDQESNLCRTTEASTRNHVKT